MNIASSAPFLHPILGIQDIGLKLDYAFYADEFPTTPFPICFTRNALHCLISTVGLNPAETGAKLLGPIGRLGVDTVEYDIPGSRAAGGAVYSPSTLWGNQCVQHYLQRPEPQMRAWVGDVHSHPAHIGRLSPKVGPGLGDQGYIERVFETNEAFKWFFSLIITGSATGRVIIHPWIALRKTIGKGVELFQAADVRICDDVSQWPRHEYDQAWIDGTGQTERKDPNSAETSENEISSSGVYCISPEISDLPTANTSSVVSADQVVLQKKYLARLEGIVSPAFHDKSIAVVGTGAASYLTECLARLTPASLRLLDEDIVEVPNLSRTLYTMADATAHRKKVVALAERINAVNPFVKVQPHAQNLFDLSLIEEREYFSAVDLLIAGTDDFRAQAKLNEISVRYGIPAIFVGIHRGGEGGRIIWSIPPVTPCYRCLAGERYDRADAGDLETLNLSGERGSVADSLFIDNVVLKVALAILERGQNSRLGKFFDKMQGRTEIIVRCSPDYEYGRKLWDAVLSDLPTEPKLYSNELRDQALFAMDSMWLRTHPDPACPICSRDLIEKGKIDKVSPPSNASSTLLSRTLTRWFGQTRRSTTAHRTH